MLARAFSGLQEVPIRFNPFASWRPPADRVERVASPPYDVVSREEAALVAEGNPLSFLHIGRSDIDLPADVDPHASEVYDAARIAFDRFRVEGTLCQDAEQSIYLYALTWRGRTQVGVVGCVHIDDYEADIIKKHERTRPEKEDDRTRHMVTLRANAEPVILTFRDTARLHELVGADQQATPIYDFVADDDVRHRVWRVEKPGAYVAAFADVPSCYVADGHHRTAGGWRAGKALREANPHHTGSEEYNWTLAALFPASELTILPYNRTVRDLGGRSIAEVRQALAGTGTFEETTTPEPEASGQFGVYLEGCWYRLTLDPASIDRTDPVRALDAALLHDRILAPVFGIGDARTDARIDFVGGIRGSEELAQRVDRGDAAVGIAMYPTSVEQLLAVADAGSIMPPKSTWFEPKLRSGLFVHTLE